MLHTCTYQVHIEGIIKKNTTRYDNGLISDLYFNACLQRDQHEHIHVCSILNFLLYFKV